MGRHVVGTVQCWLPLIFVVLCGCSKGVRGFPSGAGSCIGGEAAVGGDHLARPETINATLAERGIQVSIGGNVVTPGQNFGLLVGDSLEVEIFATQNQFRGALIRLEPLAGQSVTGGLTPGTNAVPAEICETPVVGITHSDNELKQIFSGTLMVDTLGETTLDITVVEINSAVSSIYMYGGFDIVFIPQAPASAPVVAPVGDSTPTSAPTITFAPVGTNVTNAPISAPTITFAPVAANGTSSPTITFAPVAANGTSSPTITFAPVAANGTTAPVTPTVPTAPVTLPSAPVAPPTPVPPPVQAPVVAPTTPTAPNPVPAPQPILPPSAQTVPQPVPVPVPVPGPVSAPVSTPTASEPTPTASVSPPTSDDDICPSSKGKGKGGKGSGSSSSASSKGSSSSKGGKGGDSSKSSKKCKKLKKKKKSKSSSKAKIKKSKSAKSGNDSSRRRHLRV